MVSILDSPLLSLAQNAPETPHTHALRQAISWYAMKRRVGVKQSPGISLGVGFTREGHWYRGAEAVKGKQTCLCFPGASAWHWPSQHKHCPRWCLIRVFFVCVFSLPIFRRQICFYLYFLVPGSSHSLFLKVFAGSAYLSQTDTWQIVKLSRLWT